jgi:hypothetical protein
MTIIDLANTKESFKIDYFTDLECYRTNIDDVLDLNKYYTYENYQSHHQNEKGIFNKEVATKFKDNVLSKGGTELPMELYKKFRGQEPKAEALLKRAGLI